MYRSNETLTDVNSLPYDPCDDPNAQPSQTESQLVQNLNLQLNLAVQEKEAATEMLKLSQMTLENLETVLDERRKSSSIDYIKTVKADYSEAIQLLNNKIDTLVKQVNRLREESNEYKALARDLELDNELLREKNSELEHDLSQQIKQADELIHRDTTHEEMKNALGLVETHTKEKEELVGKLRIKKQENTNLSEKCADLEHTASQMEEALRRSGVKLKEYRTREVNHLESIESYVKDINNMKETIQSLKSKLQDQEMESRRHLFEKEQVLNSQIAKLTNENAALIGEKTNLQNQILHLTQSADELQSRLSQLQVSTVDRETHHTLLQQFSRVKQQKLALQQETVRMGNQLEAVTNDHFLQTQCLTGKIQRLESQLSTLNSVLQSSNQHCQQLTEDNMEYAQELSQLRSQLALYNKVLEKNGSLSALESCTSLEEEREQQVAALDSYVGKYRDELKSWKGEYEKMADLFKQKLDFYQRENEQLKLQNSFLRNHKDMGSKDDAT